MHWAQALTLLPDAKRAHWIFGYFLILQVGLYLPRSLTSLVDICEPLPQTEQVLGIPVIIVIPHLLARHSFSGNDKK